MTEETSDSGRGITRRAIIATAAGAGSAAGLAKAFGTDGGNGRISGGHMALSQAYNVSGGLWIGPDSAKSNVSHESGRVFMATDTQVEYFSDGSSWTKLGVGSSQEPVPSVHTKEVRPEPQLKHVATVTDANLGRPHDIEVADGLAVVPGKDGHVSVISLLPRDSPSVLDTDTSYTNAETVAKYPGSGYPGYGWVVGDAATVSTVIGNPWSIGSIDVGATSSGDVNGSAWVHGEGQLALILALKGGAVDALDMSTWGSMSAINSYIPNSASPHDVAVLGTRVVICNQADSLSPKIEVINAISGANGIVSASGWSTVGTLSDPTLNGANRIESHHGRYVLVACNYAGTLASVDLADDTAPVLADTVDTGAASGNGPSGLLKVGDWAITGTDNRVQVWDVSDPTNIGGSAGAPTAEYEFGSTLKIHDFAVDGRYLYATGQATNTLEVFDLGYPYGHSNLPRDASEGRA